jgi:hypothetical protein
VLHKSWKSVKELSPLIGISSGESRQNKLAGENLLRITWARSQPAGMCGWAVFCAGSRSAGRSTRECASESAPVGCFIFFDSRGWDSNLVCGAGSREQEMGKYTKCQICHIFYSPRQIHMNVVNFHACDGCN